MFRASLMRSQRGWIFGLAVALMATGSSARADVKLPAIFGDHMVLQRDQANPVWGWADPGEEVTVKIAGQTKTTKAGDDGAWRVKLDPLSIGDPLEMTVEGKNKLTFKDVLVGEVWICSGQSNMQWPVSAAVDPDLEILTANRPQIRLISVPQVGTQDPQRDFQGAWEVCSPESVASFSAVGYFFGRRLQETINVPIGLIDNAWGGSACEAWIPRDRLADAVKYQDLLALWAEREAAYPEAKKAFDDHQAAAEKAKANGEPAPKAVANPDALMRGNARPGNIYNGVLLPTVGYGIRGVIWYQGENNAGRAHQYRDMFPLMIETWRELWGQGDFPFYWVQLADFRAEKPEPEDSDWAELREAQTMALRLPNTGQAVIIDLGEGKDIHPRNKQDVANRLARWALSRDYGVDVPAQSPTYKSMEKKDGKVVLTFDHVDGGFRPFDVHAPVGFAIAGADRKFVWADAKITGPNTVEVWSDQVSEPEAVRYAWADNPVCNLYSNAGLPTTPFRTDDWPGVTDNVTR